MNTSLTRVAGATVLTALLGMASLAEAQSSSDVPGADAQRPAPGADAKGAPAPSAVGATLSFTRAPRAEGALTITVARQSGPDLTQPLPSDIGIWQSTLPSDWTRITCGGESTVCLPIDRADAPGAVVQLMAYPRATLTATWPTSVAGQRVRVMLSRQTPAGERALGATRGAWVLPTRNDGRLTLDVPQGMLDLRLQADGCAAVYRVGVQATATTALGVLPCVPGGSIAARVRDQQSGNTVASCVATVRPSGALVDDDTTRRFATMVTQTATCNSFGFFQVAGLAPGRYQITTDSGTHAPDTADVDVTADTEASVDLWLTAFRTLTVRLTPPVAPDGRPWTLRIQPAEKASELRDNWTRATVNASGEVRFSRMISRTYFFEVYTQDEQLTTSMFMPLPEHGGPIDIAIPLVRVVGRVSQYRQPVAGATIEVSDTQNQQRFTTDDDGRFAGWLRKLPPEQRSLSTEVTLPGSSARIFRATEPRVQDEQTVELEIDLGSSRLIATIVDAEGRPVEGVQVTLNGLPSPAGPENTPTYSGNRTDSSGATVVTGVMAGRYLVDGSSAEGHTRTLEVDVMPETDVPIQLTLINDRNHLFEVMSSQGLPMAGAWIGIKSDTVMVNADRATDGAGQVRLSVAVNSRHTAVNVAAESQMLWSGCIVTGDSNRSRITLPPPVTGTLRVTLPLSSRGTPLLLSERGGVLRTFDLLRWKRTQVTESADADVFEIPGLAAGRYRAMLYDGIDVSPLVRANCAGTIPFNDTSSGDLTPGGVLELAWPKPKN